MRRLFPIALWSTAGFLAAQQPAPAPPPGTNVPPTMPGMPPATSPTTSQMPPPLPMPAGASMPGGQPASPFMPPTMPAPAPTPANPAAMAPAKTVDADSAAKTAAAPSPPVDDGPVIPQEFPRDRYAASWKKNPFLLKTAPVVQAKESWATDYALTSVAKMGGKYRVSIKNKKTGESRRLMQDSEEGEFKIVAVNLKAARKETSVEIQKGDEKASLTYDATMMTAQPRGAVPGQPGMARPGMPTIPGAPQGVPMPNVRTTSTGASGATNMAGSANGVRNQGGAAPSYGSSVAAGNYGSPAAAGNYGGNAYSGGGFAGGVPGGANTGAASPATVGAGAPASRLGALGPQAGATGNSGLVPMAGGTRVTTTSSGATSIDATVATDPGNIVPATTSAAQTTTPVTRRRTLIPAPVINQ